VASINRQLQACSLRDDAIHVAQTCCAERDTCNRLSVNHRGVVNQRLREFFQKSLGCRKKPGAARHGRSAGGASGVGTLVATLEPRRPPPPKCCTGGCTESCPPMPRWTIPVHSLQLPGLPLPFSPRRGNCRAVKSKQPRSPGDRGCHWSG